MESRLHGAALGLFLLIIGGGCSFARRGTYRTRIDEAMHLKKCFETNWLDDEAFDQLMATSTDDYARANYLVARRLAITKGFVARASASDDPSTHTLDMLVGSLAPLDEALKKTGSLPMLLSDVACASSPDETTRKLALISLWCNSDNTQAIAAQFVQRMHDDSPIVRATAARQIGHLAADGKPYIPFLVLGLYDEDEGVRCTCARSIERILALDFPLDQSSSGVASSPERAAREWAEEHYGEELEAAGRVPGPRLNGAR